MARPMKRRRICSLPENKEFGPLNKGRDEDFILMSLDEYETIRLIDYENYTQEEASEQMGVARTTVQGIYSEARKKLASSLVEGRQLLIDGGHYSFCDGKGRACRKKHCRRRRENENNNSCRRQGRN